MTLANAVYALEELSQGRIPDSNRALRGMKALDPFLLKPGCAQDLHDAAAILELLVATSTASISASARSRAAAMAVAVRRLIAHG
ncbi:MAG: hypothetical protein M3Y55_00770 [Pseudomonadota bacterium]|nr:hypothetical protein [Pseudomonadota bacterium]